MLLLYYFFIATISLSLLDLGCLLIPFLLFQLLMLGLSQYLIPALSCEPNGFVAFDRITGVCEIEKVSICNQFQNSEYMVVLFWPKYPR